jgi:hypothetical protein
MRRDDTWIEIETRRRAAGPKPDDTQKFAPPAASRAPMLADLFADKGNTIVCRHSGAGAQSIRSTDPGRQAQGESIRDAHLSLQSASHPIRRHRFD